MMGARTMIARTPRARMGLATVLAAVSMTGASMTGVAHAAKRIPPPDGEFVPAFQGPQFRLGIRGVAGAIAKPAYGAFAGIDVLAGARVTDSVSIIARLDVDGGGWQRGAGAAFFSFSPQAGVDVLLFGDSPSSKGTAVQLGLTGGAWVVAERTVLAGPMLTAHVGWVFKMPYVHVSAVEGWSMGALVGLGDDPAHAVAVVRLGLYVGHEFSF
jgi:hypothetical protein